MSSLFANLTDFVGCSYIVHPYFVAQSSPAMVMSLPVLTRALIRYFRYLTSMHALTSLLRTGWTSLSLCAVYEGDCIWPWFPSDVGEGQSLAKCPIPPQRWQVYRCGSVSVRDEAGASVADLAAYGFGSWVFNFFLRILHLFNTPICQFLWCFVWLFVSRRHDFGNSWTFFVLFSNFFNSISFQRFVADSVVVLDFVTSLIFFVSFRTVFRLSSFSLSLSLVHTSSCKAIHSAESKSFGCLSWTFNAKSGVVENSSHRKIIPARSSTG